MRVFSGGWLLGIGMCILFSREEGHMANVQMLIVSAMFGFAAFGLIDTKGRKL